MKHLVVSLAAFTALAFGLATASTDDTDDIDVIMSDVPLTKTSILTQWETLEFGATPLVIKHFHCDDTI